MARALRGAAAGASRVPTRGGDAAIPDGSCVGAAFGSLVERGRAVCPGWNGGGLRPEPPAAFRIGSSCGSDQHGEPARPQAGEGVRARARGRSARIGLRPRHRGGFFLLTGGHRALAPPGRLPGPAFSAASNSRISGSRARNGVLTSAPVAAGAAVWRPLFAPECSSGKRHSTGIYHRCVALEWDLR